MKRLKGSMTKQNIQTSAWLPILLCWLAYTTAYLGRLSYASNINSVIKEFGVTHAEAGLVTTCFFFAYGAGQLFNGIMCKYYNKRLVVALTLILSSVFDFALFVGIPFRFIKYLWLLNGAVQSTLWSTMIYLLSVSLNDIYLKKAVVFMTSAVAAGTFIIYGLSSLFSIFDMYTLSYLVASISLIVAAVLWIVLYKKAFNDKKEKWEKKEKNKKKEKKEKTSLATGLVVTIAVLSLFAVINGIIKDGLTSWVPAIMKEKFGLGDSLSIFMTLFLSLLGLFGARINIWLNKYVKSFISMSGIWFIITALCIGFVIMLLDTTLWILVIAFFSLISLFMFSVNNIATSMAPLYMRDKMNSGFLAGLLNTFACIGITIGSYGLGAIADSFGWNGVFYILLVVCVIPVVISGAFLISQKYMRK